MGYVPTHGDHCHRVRSFPIPCRYCGDHVIYFECSCGSKVFLEPPDEGLHACEERLAGMYLADRGARAQLILDAIEYAKKHALPFTAFYPIPWQTWTHYFDRSFPNGVKTAGDASVLTHETVNALAMAKEDRAAARQQYRRKRAAIVVGVISDYSRAVVCLVVNLTGSATEFSN